MMTHVERENLFEQIALVVREWKAYYTKFKMLYDPCFISRIENTSCMTLENIIDNVDYLGIPEVSKKHEKAITIQMNRGSCGVSSIAIGMVLENAGWKVDYYSNQDHAWILVENEFKVDTVHIVPIVQHNWSERINMNQSSVLSLKSHAESWINGDIQGYVQICGFYESFVNNGNPIGNNERPQLTIEHGLNYNEMLDTHKCLEIRNQLAKKVA